MKRINLMILVLLLITSCNAQKNTTMATQDFKTFDIKLFDSNKTNNKYVYMLNDSTKISQREKQDEYIVTVKEKDIYIEQYLKYYKNGILKLHAYYYPKNFDTGIWREYDEDGNLIKETDYDEPYKFTFEDILEVVKKRELDMSHYLFEITRNVIDGKPIWSIVYNKSEEDMVLGIIGIDGITGAITMESEQGYPEEE